MAISEPKTKEAVQEFTEEVEEKGFVVRESDGKHVKHVYREMALVEPARAKGAWYARDIDGYLDGLIERDGWYFDSANVLGVVNVQITQEETEPVLRVLYILTK